MTDDTDDLNRPLGQTQRTSRRFSLPVILSVVAVSGVIVSGVLIYAFMGSIIGSKTAAKKPAAKPAVEAAKTRPEIPATPPVAARPEPVSSVPETAAAKERTITIIDGTSGERTSVIIPSGAPPDKVRDKREAP